jgi:hypothetical protein
MRINIMCSQIFGKCFMERRKLQEISIVGDKDAEFSVLCRCSSSKAVVDNKSKDCTSIDQ